jgi:aspartate aminotransferase
MFSDRNRRLSPSGTQAITVAVDQLERQGIDIVDLGAGQPDFKTPDHIKAAGIAAISDNFTKYTPNAGVGELRAAICSRYREDYGINCSAASVIVTAGGKQALFNAAMVLSGSGDEVITHAPGWPSLIQQIRIAEAEPIVVRTHQEDGFRLHADAVLAAVTSKTKVVIINSPGNPTGSLVSEDDLIKIATAAKEENFWIVLDLCYEHLVYDEVPHNLPGVLSRRIPEQFVLVGSLSKTYAMTGWRCGWAIGPEVFISACNAIQSHVTSNVSSITQRAGIAALTGPQKCVAEMRENYRARRDQLIDWVESDLGIRCVRPGGAFYLFLDVSQLLSPGELRTSASLAEALLREAHVAVTPGEAFDAPGYLRISYATSLVRLREGVTRIKTFIQNRRNNDGE